MRVLVVLLLLVLLLLLQPTKVESGLQVGVEFDKRPVFNILDCSRTMSAYIYFHRGGDAPTM